MPKRTLFTVACLMLGVGACGAGTDACADAEAYVRSCVGSTARPNGEAACDPEVAAQTLATDCASLKASLGGEKADGPSDELWCMLGYRQYCHYWYLSPIFVDSASGELLTGLLANYEGDRDYRRSSNRQLTDRFGNVTWETRSNTVTVLLDIYSSADDLGSCGDLARPSADGVQVVPVVSVRQDRNGVPIGCSLPTR